MKGSKTGSVLFLMILCAFAIGCSAPAATPLPVPTSTRVPSSPTPPQNVTLGGFPFQVGTTWVYSRLQYQQVVGDPRRIMTATNLITETVVRVDGTGSSQAFLYGQTASLVSAPPDWRDNTADFNREDWYRINGARIFSSPEGFSQISMLVYEFPLVVGNSWCPEQPPPDYNPTCHANGLRHVQDRMTYATPLGAFDDCFEITEEYNSGGVTEWFCNGIGTVARKYDHGGTRFGFEDKLIRYSRP